MEAALQMQQTFKALQENNKPNGCIFSTADELLESVTKKGEFSIIELRAWFGIGSHRTARIKKPKLIDENAAAPGVKLISLHETRQKESNIAHLYLVSEDERLLAL